MFLGDGLGQVAVCGRDHAEIHIDGLGPAQPGECLLLHHAQQIDLRLEADVSHLVEEDRTAVGKFEFSLPLVLRAGEGSPLVAEELAFHQALRQSGAVCRYQGHGPSGALLVDRLCHQFLARAAVADNEHGGVRAGHGPNQLLYLVDARAFTHDFRHVLRGECFHLFM